MSFSRTYRSEICAALVSVCFVALTFTWICLDHSPANWDDAWYLTNSLVLFDALADRGVGGYVRQFFTILGGAKAPLITALPTPVYLIFGRNPRCALAVNLAAMVVLFAAIYFLGSRLANSRTGVLAVTIAGTMPLLYGLSHWYLVETSLAALVCSAVGLLIASDGLRRTWAVVALGICAGIGLLLKISFLLYLLPLFVYTVIRHASFVRNGTIVLRTIGTFALAVIAVAAPWYLLNSRTVISTAWRSAYSRTASAAWGTGDVFSPGAIRTYLERVVQNGVSEFYAVLAIIVGLYLAVRRVAPMSSRASCIFGLWFLPFVVFLFAPNKDVRFLAPLLPALALALAAMLDRSFSAGFRWSSPMLCLLLSWPSIAMLRTSFALPMPGRDLGYARLFNPARWPHHDIVSAIAGSLTLHPGQRTILMVGTDTGFFNANNFELAAVRARLPIQVVSSAYAENADSVISAVRSAAFVVFEEGGPSDAESFNRYRSALVSEVRTSGHFNEMDARRLPDGGVARLYRHISQKLTGTDAWRFEGRSFTTGRVGELKRLAVDFADEIRLEGLALERGPASLSVSYGWRCLRVPGADYWCFTHVLDESGAVIGYLDHAVLAGDPATSSWKPGDVLTEQIHFSAPGIRAREKYRLRLGLFQLSSGRRVPVTRAVAGPSWTTTVVESGTGVLAEALSPEAKPAAMR